MVVDYSAAEAARRSHVLAPGKEQSTPMAMQSRVKSSASVRKPRTSGQGVKRKIHRLVFSPLTPEGNAPILP
jgi:hypothetical protein